MGLAESTSQQLALPQPAVPSFLQRVLLPYHPQGTMAGACSSQQAAAVPRDGVAAGPVMLTPPPAPPVLGATVFGNTPAWLCTFLGSTHGLSALCTLMPSLPP